MIRLDRYHWSKYFTITILNSYNYNCMNQSMNEKTGSQRT